MNKRIGWHGVTTLILIILALTGCDASRVQEIDLNERIDSDKVNSQIVKPNGNSLRFGFDLRASPDEDARQYLPFLKYLEKKTGLNFELRFPPKDLSIVDLLGTGKVHFAAIGGVSYLVAHEKYGVIPLLHGLNADGRSEYQSVIVVAPGSSIQRIEDLRGRRFAFGDITSTQGHLIPRIMLAEKGIWITDLAEYEFTGSHYNCVNAVVSGGFDAGGVQDMLGRRMAAEGLLRILTTSDFYPSSGIAANRDVPAGWVQKVKKALLDFRPEGADAQSLYHWDLTEMAGGFSEATDADYSKMRDWAIKLGLFGTIMRDKMP
jgi:phosphonate transport system substrate-binding protein